MGSRGKKAGKVKGRKTKKGKRDRDWQHEGAQFGGAQQQTEHGNGEEDAEARPLKRMRCTQLQQDKERRRKLGYVKKLKARSKDQKFDKRREELESLEGVPVKKKRRKKPRNTDAPPPPPNVVRYAWLRARTAPSSTVGGANASSGEQQQVDGQEDDEMQRGKRVTSYSKLLAALSDKAHNKYRELLERRKLEQEGLDEESTSGEEEEEEDDAQEDSEEDEFEGEEVLGQVGRTIALANGNGVYSSSEDTSSEAEDPEGDAEQLGGMGSGAVEDHDGIAGGGVDENDAEADADARQGEESGVEGLTGEEGEEDENDTSDSFVRHFERAPLELQDDGSGAVGAPLRRITLWSSRDIGQDDDSDPIEVQATGDDAATCLVPKDPVQAPHLKKILLESWGTVKDRGSSALQTRLWPLLDSYRDLFLSTVTWDNAGEIQRVMLLHMLNHVLKARGRVIKHNQRRRKHARAQRVKRVAEQTEKELGKMADGDEKGVNGSGEVLEDDDEPDRDQGFARPRVLVLLPMRSNAMQMIKTMIAMLGCRTSVIGTEKLEESYGEGEEDDKEREGRKRKPEDWQKLFDGNCDDDFKLGIALTPGQGKGKGSGKGVAVKLFSEFYHSDVIVASPLGLRLVIEAQKDHDFLSSLELLIVDQTDVLMMQNWDHVLEVLQLVNDQPRQDHNTDFSRVRQYLLEGQATRFRQTVMLSRFMDPLMVSVFNKMAQSFEGKVRLKRRTGAGSICEVALRIKQVFHRVPCTEARLQGDSRFEYFTKSVLPDVQRLQQTRTLIFIPSYYDFVRLRNHVVREKLSHCCLSEYERVSEASRSRARFFHGQRDMMLYTGRAHFFKRYMIRGARHLIFYSLPEDPHFYSELVNLLEEAENSADVTSCLVLFTKYEILALERIVGSDRARHMLQSDKSTFLFC